jgi:HD-GYP domain-containing protein (c-di-GMP phosphodiesterase class II)/DNA-binding CsgD family transcriptional regulator
VDFADPQDAVARITDGIGRNAAPADREAAIGNLLGDGPGAARAHDAAQCDAGERLAALLPVSEASRSVATDAFERWDGQGGPAGKSGDELSLVARIVEVGYVAELFAGREGPEAALRVLRRRSGLQLDPALVAAFCSDAPARFAALDDARRSAWEQLLELEPAPHLRLSSLQVDAVALAFARFADLKSTWFVGHSEAVARLAASAATTMTLGPEAVGRVRLAGLLHDLGRVMVPTGTWDLPRPLSPPERDRVEQHARETQRILGSCELFRGVAVAAGAAHERLDGTGYHRGLPAAALGPEAMVLAAADVAVALSEARPYRRALDEQARATVLRAEVSAGRLDRVAVGAVLDAGGSAAAAHAVSTTRLAWPAALSDREVEVLRALASGGTNKDVARALGIRAKTVAHHVAHIYAKIGCRSRAGATLFALEHGLVGPTAPADPGGGRADRPGPIARGWVSGTLA